MKYFR